MIRKHLIVTLLSFTVSCVSNSFLFASRRLAPSDCRLLPSLRLIGGKRLANFNRFAAEMLARSPEDQHWLGYFHALHEICQLPSAWISTSDHEAIGACLIPDKRRDFQPHFLWLGRF